MIATSGGTAFEPPADVVLDGTSSTSSTGTITGYQWTLVSHPPGVTPQFDPSENDPTPSLRLEAVGQYVVRLAVSDTSGASDCAEDQVVLEALGDASIRVELIWSTPGDPDPNDTGPGAGADLDLHVIHASAVGVDIDGDMVPDGWFDGTYDCFVSNPMPDWGIAGTAQDPWLYRADADGLGPEVLRLDLPEAQTFRVGVHCRDDAGFGTSFATVRMYVDGTLVYEALDVALLPSDLWQVLDVTWPGGAYTVLDDGAGSWDISPGVTAP